MKIKIHEPKLRPEKFPELQQTAELVGEFIEYWGFKKVHGRIWTHLFLSPQPLHTRQLVELLGISSALVCNSIADLLKFGVILEAGKGRNGVLLYQANPKVGRVIAGVLRSRERPLLERISRGVEQILNAPALRKEQPIRIDEKRLAQLAGWIELAQTYLAVGVAYIEVEGAHADIAD